MRTSIVGQVAFCCCLAVLWTAPIQAETKVEQLAAESEAHVRATVRSPPPRPEAIAAKVDNDCMDALQTASLIYDGSQAQISYNAIVDAVDLFEEEMGCSDKVLFIHPKQVTQLRKNPDFLSADKYTPGVSLTGEIGMIAGCRLVPSKKFPLTEGVYACPIVKLEADPEVDDEIPALTIYRKREVNIETERKPKTRTTEITADEFYVAVLSNEAKVVLAKFKA